MSAPARIDELKPKFDDNPRRYFAPLANEYRKAGDLDRAIALCREHLSEQPEHLSGHVVLGKALFARGDRDRAREAFERALEVDPENVDALHQLALLARDAGDGASALELARRALAVDPFDPELMAMASDLSAPPDEDVAPPSFDPRSMFEDFTPLPAAAPSAAETLPESSRPRALDDLLRGLPPEALEPSPPQSSAAEPAAPEQAAEAVGEADAAVDAPVVAPAAEVAEPGTREPDAAPAEPVAVEAGAVEPAGPERVEPAAVETAGAPEPAPDAMEYWGGPPTDELPDVPDSLISDWPAESEEEPSAAGEAAEPSASAEWVDAEASGEQQLVAESEAQPGEELGVQPAGALEAEPEGEQEAQLGPERDTPEAPQAPALPDELEPFEFTPPEESPNTTPHGDPLREPVEEAAEDASSEETPAAPETPAAEMAGEAPDATTGGVEWPDLEWPASEPSVEAPAADTGASLEAMPAFEPPPALETDWPSLDEATSEALDADEATSEAPDADEAEAGSPQADVAGQGDPLVPHAAPAERELPADPPLARLPEEAEVPAESRVAFATGTMAELLASQGRREEAVRLYAQLALERPDDPEIRRRIEELATGGAERIADEPSADEASADEASPDEASAGQVDEPAPAAPAPAAMSQAQALPMRDLLSRILSYTPEAGGERIATPATSAPPQPAPADAGPAAFETGVPVFDETRVSAGDDLAARALADAGAAIADPHAADAFEASADAQAESIGAVLAGRTSGEPHEPPAAPAQPRSGARQAPSFSFDQFFRDAASDEPAGGTAQPDPEPPQDAQRREGDVDDFRAWLDGLRKP